MNIELKGRATKLLVANAKITLEGLKDELNCSFEDAYTLLTSFLETGCVEDLGDGDFVVVANKEKVDTYQETYGDRKKVFAEDEIKDMASKLQVSDFLVLKVIHEAPNGITKYELEKQYRLEPVAPVLALLEKVGVVVLDKGKYYSRIYDAEGVKLLLAVQKRKK